MHFCYLDETGCSGADLGGEQEPIFVLGGLSVKDQGWVETTRQFNDILCAYFDIHNLPVDFELHAHQLLSPEGDGSFLGHSRDQRNQLAFDLLDLLSSRSHQAHFLALDKSLLNQQATGQESATFDARVPYLLGYDYLVTYINEFAKVQLGHTARAMIILDIKPQFDQQIREITRFRRFGVAKAHRLKWLVEFSYPINSKRHPMIQFSDLLVFCVRKFAELDRGYRDNWPNAAKTFYAQCYAKIHDRLWRKTLIEQDGAYAGDINDLLRRCWLKPSNGWKAKYGIN